MLRATTACTFSTSLAPEGRKVLAKRWGAEPCGQMRDEKLHAVVAQSTFRSQKAKGTSCSDRFWKLRCRKSARRCGAKHLWKSKYTKHTRVGALLEIQIIGKTQCFSLSLCSDLLSSSLFFSDSSRLCFSICPYCRKFDF